MEVRLISQHNLSRSRIFINRFKLIDMISNHKREQSNKLSSKYYELMKEALSLLRINKKAAERKFEEAARIINTFEGNNSG